MTKQAILVRYEQTSSATRGLLLLGSSVLHTLEPPDLNNQEDVSCIPRGIYECVHRWSAAYKHHLHVRQVPDRTYVLIHIGNYPKNTKGCILPGTHRAFARGAPAVWSSGVALRQLLRWTDEQSFMLEIK